MVQKLLLPRGGVEEIVLIRLRLLVPVQRVEMREQISGFRCVFLVNSTVRVRGGMLPTIRRSSNTRNRTSHASA